MPAFLRYINPAFWNPERMARAVVSLASWEEERKGEKSMSWSCERDASGRMEKRAYGDYEVIF